MDDMHYNAYLKVHVYRTFIFHPISICFFFFEWMILRVYVNLSTDFLYLLWFQKDIFLYVKNNL